MILITGLRYYAQYNFLSSLLSESESESEPTVTVNLVLLPLLSQTPATPATRRYLGVAQVEFVLMMQMMLNALIGPLVSASYSLRILYHAGPTFTLHVVSET